MSCKKYLLQFGSITCCIHFRYFIFYVYVLSCTWNQSKQIREIYFCILQIVNHDRKWCPFCQFSDPQKYQEIWSFLMTEPLYRLWGKERSFWPMCPLDQKFSVQQVFALCNWGSFIVQNFLIFEVVKLCRMKNILQIALNR